MKRIITFKFEQLTYVNDGEERKRERWINEENQAYLRKLNIIGLNDEKRIRNKNDYRNKNGRVKIYVKQSKEKMQETEETKMENAFKRSKKLFYPQMWNENKKGSSSTE